MSVYYPFGRTTYSDYLQANSFVRDITGAIRSAGASVAGSIESSTAATCTAISDQTEAVVASNEALTDEFGRGFNAVNRTLDWGFRLVSQGLDNVRSSIEDLNATFSYNMGLIVTQLQVQSRLLLGVVERLHAIHKTLENPTLTQAREFFRAGCERLERGLLDKALEAFLKSEEKNDTDFLTQLQLGRLYLYGKDDDDDVVNLEKARNHLLLAARFGRAEISFLPEASASTGEALLHAAIACFLLASEAQLAGDAAGSRGRLEESVRHALAAAALRPALGQAHYQAASGLALLGKTEEAIASLQMAVATDGKYGLRVMDDRIFAAMHTAVTASLTRLRDEFLSRTREALVAKRREIDSYVFIGEEAQSDRRDIDALLAKIEQMLARNTLLDCQHALSAIDRISANVRRTGSARKLDNFFGTYDGYYGAFNSDGSLLACRGVGGKQVITFWDVHEHRELATLTGHYGVVHCIAFSPDGSLLATGDGDRKSGSVRLWDVHERRELCTLASHPAEVYSVVFSPDGTLLASGSGGDSGRLWDVHARRELAAFPMCSVGAFSPDGALLAGTSNDNTVKLWDVHHRREIVAFPKCQWGAFSPTGSLLAYVEFGSPSSIKLWDVREHREVATLAGHADGFMLLAFSPDGSRLAAAAARGCSAIKLWDVHERGEVATLVGHSDGVEFIIFSPDGSLLASGGRERCIVDLWDTYKLREFATLSDPDKCHTSVFSGTFGPDGALFACTCPYYGAIVVWDVPVEGVLPRVGWERIQAVRQKATEAAEERERMARQAAEEQERKAKEAAETRQRKAREAAEAAQRQLDREMLEIERRRSGLCIRCGTKLSMLRRLSGHGDCGRC